MGFLLVSDIIKMAQKQMEDAGITDVKNDSEALYCYLKHVDRARFFMEWSEPADDLTCENYFDLVARRCRHEPLQLILGEVDFMGVPIKVEPGVLIPRLDTEVVAEEAERIIKEKGYKTLLDLCCGSGALGIALSKLTGAKLTAADIDDKAIEMTTKNAAANGVKADVVKGDMFGAVARKKFDMIVCNPPYIPTDVIPTLMPEVKDYEPLAALNGGEDGLDFYRRIAEEAPAYLKKGGCLVLEIGAEQGEAVRGMLDASPAFTDVTVKKDLAKLDRVVTAFYDEKGAKQAAKDAAAAAKEAAKQAKQEAKEAAKKAKQLAKEARK